MRETDLLASLREQMQGNLSGAIGILEELNKRLVGTPEVEPFVFLLGVAYQDAHAEGGDAGMLNKAISAYEKYVKEFPQGDKIEFVQMNLAGALEESGKVDGAIQAYEKIYRARTDAVLAKDALRRICALYIKNGRAREGIPLFREAFETSIGDPEMRAQTATWLLQGYLAEGDTEKMRPYLRYLTGRFEAVYDPKFNIDILKYGDSFFDAKDFRAAMLLYSFVKPREEIVAFYEDTVVEGARRLRFVPKDSPRRTVLEARLAAAEANLEAVGKMRDYDADVRWRTARVYRSTARHWEALWAFYHLYLDYPGHKQVEDFVYTAFLSARETGSPRLVEELSKKYLNTPGWTKFRGPVYIALAEGYRDQARFPEMLALIDEFFEGPSDAASAAQLASMIGIYYMQERDYGRMLAFMSSHMSAFEEREPALETLLYWSALAQVTIGDYEAAVTLYQRYVDSYSRRNIYYEDSIYRYAISLYGVKRYEDAESAFKNFVERYPRSVLRGEAELYLGDLKRDRGAMDEAAGHYRSVGQHTENDVFISRAVFSLSDLLNGAGQTDEALQVLDDYIETYGVTGRLADAMKRVAEIIEGKGRLEERFSRSLYVILELGSDPTRYSVDNLIESYVKDYYSKHISFRNSTSLLEQMVEDGDFRSKFLKDRAFQYRRLEEDGAHVDPKLAYKLQRDREFRSKVIETEIKTDPQTGMVIEPSDEAVTAEDSIALLTELLVEYETKLSLLEPFDPLVVFSDLKQAGTASGSSTIDFRMAYAMHLAGRYGGEASPSGERVFSEGELAEAPPRILFWQGALRGGTALDEAERIYRSIIEKHPYSDLIYEALVALGDLSILRAESTESRQDWEKALGYFQVVIDRFAFRAEDGSVYLKQGRVLGELDRMDDAITVLGSVLKNPQWRGRDHAEAHLRLGIIDFNRELLEEAHGWFERLIVAYGGFREIVAEAYYYDLRTLEKMGEAESVDQLLAEYRTRMNVLSETEAHAKIEEAYDL